MKGLGLSEMASITCSEGGSSVVLLEVDYGEDPAARS